VQGNTEKGKQKMSELVKAERQIYLDYMRLCCINSGGIGGGGIYAWQWRCWTGGRGGGSRKYKYKKSAKRHANRSEIQFGHFNTGPGEIDGTAVSDDLDCGSNLPLAKIREGGGGQELSEVAGRQ
jgi:hypothetical protein